MTNLARLIIILLMASLLPMAAESSEYQLFSPGSYEGELLLPERGKGVLVRRITIKPGDTLSSISRRFSGRGSWFPQILLFNDIKNPDLIIAGNELLVPVSKLAAAAKPADAEKVISPPAQKEPAVKAKPAAKSRPSEPAEKISPKPTPRAAQESQLPGQTNTREEQQAYASAIDAFRREEYKKAMSLFSRFLERYPSSALAPDASFHKAECLLKLSGQ